MSDPLLYARAQINILKEMLLMACHDPWLQRSWVETQQLRLAQRHARPLALRLLDWNSEENAVCLFISGWTYLVLYRIGIGCDHYMARANLVSDSDCSSICDADHTELCGAGNRLAVYQDTTATPLSFQNCIPSSLITPNDETPYDFTFFMVPASGGGTPVPLALIPNGDPFSIHAGETTEQFFQLSVRSYYGIVD